MLVSRLATHGSFSHAYTWSSFIGDCLPETSHYGLDLLVLSLYFLCCVLLKKSSMPDLTLCNVSGKMNLPGDFFTVKHEDKEKK